MGAECVGGLVITLHLGVVDVGYSDKSGKTTGEVAEILENKYHVVESFLKVNESFIKDSVANEIQGRIESILQGAPVTPKGSAIPYAKIDEKFRDFLDSGQMRKILPASMQVKAAEQGVSHRMKNPTSRTNKPRQPFIDTSLYQASFRSWSD